MITNHVAVAKTLTRSGWGITALGLESHYAGTEQAVISSEEALETVVVD